MRSGLLTRKQIWRKCGGKSIMYENNENYENYENNIPDNISYIKKNLLSNFNLLTKYIVNDDEYNNEKEIFGLRKVKFNRHVKVVLIPELYEYKACRLDKKLWYSFDDYIGFRMDYENELLRQQKYNTI
jgi:hypothetical protein